MQTSAFFSGKGGFQPRADTEAAKTTIRSIIDQRLLDDESWAVSIVHRRGTEHAFLIIEGMHGTQPVQFRSDLFLNSRGNSGHSAQRTGTQSGTMTGGVGGKLLGAAASGPPAASVGGAVGAKAGHAAGRAMGMMLARLLGASESSRGEAFIRVKEITLTELKDLAKTSDFKSWPLSKTEATALLKSLEQWGNKTLTYHMAGDSPIYSASTSTTRHHNCVTWCMKVLTDLNPDKFQSKAGRWKPIKRPSDVVTQYQATDAAPAARPGQ